ncbi:hypothetical protein B7463_g1553, partial [Scytalidium lignicola]
MSFGFSVGDFIAAGDLAYRVWFQCQAASEDYNELGELCHEINIAVGTCQPLDPHSVLRRQSIETITRLSANCHITLKRLEAILHDHQDMRGLHGLGRKLGFVMSKKEIENIKSRLQLHLSTINTFLNNVQVDTLNLTVRLLFKGFQNQLGNPTEEDIRAIINSPDKLNDLFKEVQSDNKTLNTGLDEDKDAIRQKLEEAMKTGRDDGHDTSEQREIPSPVTTADFNSPRDSAVMPAKPKSSRYDPYSINWYRMGGSEFLIPIRNNIPNFILPIESAVMTYSKNEQWLSRLPEGCFHHNGFPFDLDDDLSGLLASKLIGSKGHIATLTNEDIDASLPENWTWFEITDELGITRQVYQDTVTEEESTVHPARFLCQGDSPTSHVLPPGWQRRLDS